MKVGIITMHGIRNYGSFMQAYGLQRALEKLGHVAEIINYQYPNKAHPTYPRLKSRILHFANVMLKCLLPGCPGIRFERRYNQCHHKYYRLSKAYATRDDLFNSPPKYDAYIAGSDQIWRPRFTGGDSVFFADFAPEGARRISYASSFGCLAIDALYREQYARNIEKLNSISVRERSAVDIVKQLSGRTALQVLDPSLLLSGDEWRSVAIPSGVSDYVVCYGAVEKDYIHKLAHRYADKRGFKVIRIAGKFMDYFCRSEKYVIDAGPREWLGLFAGAKAIFVGSSFHGTAFAILFHKPFISLLSGNSDHDARQLSLLQLLGLEQKGVYRKNFSEEELEDALSPLDWGEVERNLSTLRSESLEYLERALK